MAYEAVSTVVASAARTATGQSSAININGIAPAINLLVDCPTVTGTTPALDLSVEWSPDGGTTWCVADAADTFTQITAAKQVAKRFTVKAPTYRVKWTIGGASPSFTFSVYEYRTA
jgi:hypothetical protein